MKLITMLAVILVVMAANCGFIMAEDEVSVSAWGEGEPDFWGEGPENIDAESEWDGGIPGAEPAANAIIAAGGDEDTGSFD